MDISKMKALTKGMKDIKETNSGKATEVSNEYMEYLNKGMEALNADNTEQGIKYLKKAAQQIPAASYTLFAVYIGDLEDVSNGLKWLKKAAEGGIIDAMNNLADFYYGGNMVEKDFAQAFKWAKKAANTTPNKDNHINEESIQKACFNLAMCYFNGIGTPQNPAEAFAMFKKAGELGCADAMFYIAEMYRKGIGVIANEKTADEWVKKGVDLGNPGSMISYANRLEEEYLDKLNNWNETSNQGDSFWDKLGRVVTFVGGAWLQMKITDLYKKAAELGNLDGYFHLGVFYSKKANSKHSFNEHADRKDAIYYLTKGVEGGHAYCMWILGTVYEIIYNILDGKNDSEYQEKLKQARGSTNEERAANLALHWYEQAANNGVEEARQAYDEFSSKLRNRNSGGGGCFITTAVCENFGKPDDCYELTAFRNFRDNWLINQSGGKSLIEEYYKIAPNIVSKIDSLPSATQIYKKIWENYLAPCLNLIENGDNQACKCLYIEMVNSLKKKFL